MENEDREVMWQPEGGLGIEHVHLATRQDARAADGIMVLRDQGHTVRIRYAVTCDAHWRTRDVHVSSLNPGEPGLHMYSDGQGHWSDEEAKALDDLDGCLDVDLWAVAFTNTLPIRRLGLRPGEQAEIAVAYVYLPDMSLAQVRQRYTLIEQLPDGARYRFEGLDSGFSAEIMVDAEGLVVEYPALGRRIWHV